MPDEGHDSNVLPEEWRYLPFLALPDGAHNYQEGRNSSGLRAKREKKGISTGEKSAAANLCESKGTCLIM